MSEGTPYVNFGGAIVLGLVIGLVGWFVLRGKQPNVTWLVPALAVAGGLVASVLAVIFGDRVDYGWKEFVLQIVLAAGGVALAAFLGSKKPAGATSGAPATE